MRENYRYPSSNLDDDYEPHTFASPEGLKSSTKWTPEYSVNGDLMIFHNIDTPEKRLAMIKAYESLEEGGKDA